MSDVFSRNMVLHRIPTDEAYKMREKNTKRWPGNDDDMSVKRTDNTMRVLTEATEKGTIDPIPVEEKDFKKGILTEGRHRIIVAKRLGKKDVLVDVYKDE